MTPGQTEMDALVEAGLVDESTIRKVGDFELVVITQRDQTLKLTKPEDLRQCETLSMPDPDINSVGTSGRLALQKLGLWEELEPKFVKTKRAIQSHTYVAGGKSDAGIAYRNCPLETNPDKLSTSKVKIAFSFPEDSYDRQPCLVAVLNGSENLAAAQGFTDFLSSADGLKILEDNGLAGCLDLVSCEAVAVDETAEAIVTVRAFYPGNEAHDSIRKMIEGLSDKYGGKVKAEFIDFTSDEGFDKWQEAGLSCGAILINDQQTWTYEKDGKPVEVTFKMAIDGEWTQDDLDAVIQKVIDESGGEKTVE